MYKIFVILIIFVVFASYGYISQNEEGIDQPAGENKQQTATPILQDVTVGEGEVCEVDEDCVHFGKTGDCNCGCYVKGNLPADAGHAYRQAGGECDCEAPTSCECVEGTCKAVF